MPRKTPSRHGIHTTQQSAESRPSDLTTARLTGEQLRRWAQLIASGEAAFPSELSPEARGPLLLLVGRYRRERLIRFIARAIAQDLHRAERRSKDSTDAETYI